MLLGVGFGESTPRDHAPVRLLQAFGRCGGRLALLIDEDHRDTGLDEGAGDARTHRPGADDADRLQFSR